MYHHLPSVSSKQLCVKVIFFQNNVFWKVNMDILPTSLTVPKNSFVEVNHTVKHHRRFACVVYIKSHFSRGTWNLVDLRQNLVNFDIYFQSKNSCLNGRAIGA